jgi:hypothetical protein
MLRLEIYYDLGSMPGTSEKRFMQDWCMDDAEKYIEKRQRLLGFRRAFIYLTHGDDQVEIKKYVPL